MTTGYWGRDRTVPASGTRARGDRHCPRRASCPRLTVEPASRHTGIAPSARSHRYRLSSTGTTHSANDISTLRSEQVAWPGLRHPHAAEAPHVDPLTCASCRARICRVLPAPLLHVVACKTRMRCDRPWRHRAAAATLPFRAESGRARSDARTPPARQARRAIRPSAVSSHADVSSCALPGPPAPSSPQRMHLAQDHGRLGRCLRSSRTLPGQR